MKPGHKQIWQIMEEQNFLHGMWPPCYVEAALLRLYGTTIEGWSQPEANNAVIKASFHLSKMGSKADVHKMLKEFGVPYQSLEKFLAELNEKEEEALPAPATLPEIAPTRAPQMQVRRVLGQVRLDYRDAWMDPPTWDLGAFRTAPPDPARVPRPQRPVVPEMPDPEALYEPGEDNNF